MDATNYLLEIPELEQAIRAADHVDIKTVTSIQDLREFVAGMFNYQPRWVTFLFRFRAVFVRFLGLRQNGIPQPAHLKPSDIPFRTGAKLAFFQVSVAKEGKFWLAEVDDTHLSARLAVVVQPIEGQFNRFYVITIVNYHKWTGPVYFNIIRPFHHLVVGGMTRAGAQSG